MGVAVQDGEAVADQRDVFRLGDGFAVAAPKEQVNGLVLDELMELKQIRVGFDNGVRIAVPFQETDGFPGKLLLRRACDNVLRDHAHLKAEAVRPVDDIGSP